MLPAFATRWAAVRFILLVSFILVLPVLLPVFGLSSRLEVWKGMSHSTGPVAKMVYDLSIDKTPVDIVVIGTSPVRNAIDLRAIESYLSEKSGRPVHARFISMFLAGGDAQYALLHDYLETHQPKLAILGEPQPFTNLPHPFMHRWLRYGEYADVFGSASLPSRTAIYGELVMGAPRQLLTRLRPNRVYKDQQTDSFEEDAISIQQHGGYLGAKFERCDVPTKTVADRATTRSKVISVDPPIGDSSFSIHCFTAMLDLLSTKKIRVAILHVPLSTEYGSDQIPMVQNWEAIVGHELRVLGIPAKKLFSGLSKDQFVKFYYDQRHFNQNGRKAFTDSLLPAINAEFRDISSPSSSEVRK